MELFSLPVSSYSSKVRIALDLKGVDYTTSPPPGGYSTPEYMQLVPLGTIPALRDGEMYLSESDVIMEYIEERFPEPALLTGDAKARAKHRFLARYHDLWLEPHLRRTFEHVDPSTRNDEVLNSHLDKFAERLNTLEKLFNPQPYMVGDTIGYADCAFPATIELADILLPVFGRELTLGPKMQAWRETVRQHPIVKGITDEGIEATQQWMKNGGG